MCKKNSITFVPFVTYNIKRKNEKDYKDSHNLNYFISMLSTTGGKLKVSLKILENYNKIKE